MITPLKKNSYEYLQLLEKIILNKSFNQIVKTRLGWKLRQFILEPTITKQICSYYCKLVNTTDEYVIDQISIFLLYHLVQNKNSLYPDIKDFLVLLSNVSFKKRAYNELYLVDYIEEFYVEFQLVAIEILNNFINKNKFLVNNVNYSFKIADLIESMVKLGIPKSKETTIIDIINTLVDSGSFSKERADYLLGLKSKVR